MQYYVSDERRGRIWAGVATLAAYVLCLVLMLLIKFSLHTPRPDLGEGIMINFGNTEQAGGEADLPLTDEVAQAPSPSQPATAPARPVTSDHGDVAVPQPDKPRTTQSPQVVEQPRTADPRALFRAPGRTAGSTSTSEGTGTGQGNQGNLAGSPDGSHTGTGTGTSGTAFNLSGRSIVGSLPKPDYNSPREGRVVVEITVNGEGRVTAANYRAAGSVGVDQAMIADALAAARKARFNGVNDDAGLQTGTITYVFKLK